MPGSCPVRNDAFQPVLRKQSTLQKDIEELYVWWNLILCIRMHDVLQKYDDEGMTKCSFLNMIFVQF